MLAMKTVQETPAGDARLLRLRPCIDLKDGHVVQIVGGTLAATPSTPNTIVNFTSERSSAVYARRYRADRLTGGHIIALGPGNQEAALAALKAFPGGMQMGGGITPENAGFFLDAGASHVIVTSYVFREGRVDYERLDYLVKTVGKERLVLDLSCRKRDGDYWIVTDRWKNFTTVRLNRETLQEFAPYCDEFLVHAVDVEGKKAGVDTTLVEHLVGSPIPITYAGGVTTWDDVERVQAIGDGKIDLTIGSALDLFGGNLPYRDLVAWQRRRDGRNTNELGQVCD
jgi:phosphoribosylformimino-5-aminoimidazole carboxamide ribotide isomerase